MLPPAPYIFGVWGTSTSNIYAATVGLLHWDGTSWQKSARFAAVSFKGIWGFAADDIYAVGEGVVVHFDGHDWAEVYRDDNIDFTCIWGPTPDRVFVGYDGGVLLGSGSTWAASLASGDFAVSDIHGVGTGFTFAAGRGGRYAIYDDSTWSEHVTEDRQLFQSVWAASASEVFATSGSRLVSWNGSEWTTLGYLDSGDLGLLHAGLWGYAPDDVYVMAGADSGGENPHSDFYHWNGSTLDYLGECATTNGSGFLWSLDGGPLYGSGLVGVHVFQGSAWRSVGMLNSMMVRAISGDGRDGVIVGYGNVGEFADFSGWRPWALGILGTDAGRLVTADPLPLASGQMIGMCTNGPSDIYLGLFYTNGGGIKILHYDGSTFEELGCPASPIRSPICLADGAVVVLTESGPLMWQSGSWTTIGAPDAEGFLDLGSDGDGTLYLLAYIDDSSGGRVLQVYRQSLESWDLLAEMWSPATDVPYRMATLADGTVLLFNQQTNDYGKVWVEQEGAFDLVLILGGFISTAFGTGANDVWVGGETYDHTDMLWHYDGSWHQIKAELLDLPITAGWVAPGGDVYVGTIQGGVLTLEIH